MTFRPYIGEFKIWGFVIATVLFLLFGWFLYSKFEFRQIPTAADEISRQQAEIDRLQQRVDQIAHAAADVQGTGQKTENEAQLSRRSPNAKGRPSSRSRP
jgi:hypothetical protein